MSTLALDVRGVKLAFGGLQALDGLDLQVEPREIHGIIGPNGAGKTSSFDVMTGVYRPNAGTVQLAGQDVTSWPSHRRTQAGLARSFQTVGLAPGLTARDNVLGTIEALERVWTPFPRRSENRRRRAEADGLLEFFGLADAADTQVTDLPLGTSKLLELAKVFAGAPKVVLLDEPFAGLSTAEATERVALISARRELTDAGVVIVEHDVPLLVESCDRLTVLDRGQAVACGAPHEVMADDAVRSAYMGDVAEEAI